MTTQSCVAVPSTYMSYCCSVSVSQWFARVPISTCRYIIIHHTSQKHDFQKCDTVWHSMYLSAESVSSLLSMSLSLQDVWYVMLRCRIGNQHSTKEQQVKKKTYHSCLIDQTQVDVGFALRLDNTKFAAG